MATTFVSILNDVLGPVMRGPSSSHTAGSFHIGRVLRSLLHGEPARAVVAFDPEGSYARTFRQQGVDKALIVGLLGLDLTDPVFPDAERAAAEAGLRLEYAVEPLGGADHPNTMDAVVTSRSGDSFAARAKSTGGGGFLVTRLAGFPVEIDGKAHHVFAAATEDAGGAVEAALGRLFPRAAVETARAGKDVLSSVSLDGPAPDEAVGALSRIEGVRWVRRAIPVFRVRRGEPLFSCAAEMVKWAKERRVGLGGAALAYEAALLGMTEAEVVAELLRRWDVMEASVERGLRGEGIAMSLLSPSAGAIMAAAEAGRLPGGGVHARAAARAMAVMHVSNSGGVVVAAPTGGAAGTLPGVVATLARERGLRGEALARTLAAASGVGWALATRGTFAAEVAGCQVEIGAAGAMAAAAVVEAAGGTARQAADAAAVSFQNTMASPCDLVQGYCEIPCHTRNAALAAGAFVCADLVIGGYENPIPLDETIDAVMASGRMLPPELRCTAAGGLALCPSALHLELRPHNVSRNQ